MSDLIDYAEKELKLAGILNSDNDYNNMIAKSVMELIKVLSKQDNGDWRNHIISNLFNKLSRFENLTTLTFKDDEWIEFNNGKFYNKRRTEVQKDSKNGRPYFLDAYTKIAVFPNGKRLIWGGPIKVYTDNYIIGKCYIKNPENLVTVKIDAEVYYYGKNPGEWDFKPVKEEQLEELRKHYDFKVKRKI